MSHDVDENCILSTLFIATNPSEEIMFKSICLSFVELHPSCKLEP